MGFIGQALSGANKAPKDAAKIQAQSADRAVAEERRQYDQTRADNMPWLQDGQKALGELNDPNAFQASPSYNFVRSEGQRDLSNSFAARGGAFSGNALRALSEFNAGLASQEYGNWWNRTAGRAGVGQTTAGNLGQFGAGSAGRIGNALQNAGDARASGIMGSATVRQQGISQTGSDIAQWAGYRWGGGGNSGWSGPR